MDHTAGKHDYESLGWVPRRGPKYLVGVRAFLSKNTSAAVLWTCAY